MSKTVSASEQLLQYYTSLVGGDADGEEAGAVEEQEMDKDRDNKDVQDGSPQRDNKDKKAHGKEEEASTAGLQREAGIEPESTGENSPFCTDPRPPAFPILSHDSPQDSNTSTAAFSTAVEVESSSVPLAVAVAVPVAVAVSPPVKPPKPPKPSLLASSTSAASLNDSSSRQSNLRERSSSLSTSSDHTFSKPTQTLSATSSKGATGAACPPPPSTKGSGRGSFMSARNSNGTMAIGLGSRQFSSGERERIAFFRRFIGTQVCTF